MAADDMVIDIDAGDFSADRATVMETDDGDHLEIVESQGLFSRKQVISYSLKGDLLYCASKFQAHTESGVVRGSRLTKMLLTGSAGSAWKSGHGFLAGVLASAASDIKDREWSNTHVYHEVTLHFADGKCLHGTTSFETFDLLETSAVYKDEADFLAAQKTTAVKGKVNKLLSAAEKGDADAQFQVGRMYMQGDETAESEGREVALSRNYNEAEKWLKQSAKQGNAQAQLLLGGLYQSGVTTAGMDYQQAFELFKLSAEQGNAQAYKQLGDLYKDGLGVRQNLKEAEHWYGKAAERGTKNAQQELEKVRNLADTNSRIVAQLRALDEAKAESVPPEEQEKLFSYGRKNGPRRQKRFDAIKGKVVEWELAVTGENVFKISEDEYEVWVGGDELFVRARITARSEEEHERLANIEEGELIRFKGIISGDGGEEEEDGGGLIISPAILS